MANPVNNIKITSAVEKTVAGITFCKSSSIKRVAYITTFILSGSESNKTVLKKEKI